MELWEGVMSGISSQERREEEISVARPESSTTILQFVSSPVYLSTRAGLKFRLDYNKGYIYKYNERKFGAKVNYTYCKYYKYQQLGTNQLFYQSQNLTKPSKPVFVFIFKELTEIVLGSNLPKYLYVFMFYIT